MRDGVVWLFVRDGVVWLFVRGDGVVWLFVRDAGDGVVRGDGVVWLLFVVFLRFLDSLSGRRMWRSSGLVRMSRIRYWGWLHVHGVHRMPAISASSLVALPWMLSRKTR